MEMRHIYIPLDKANEQGKFYEECDVPTTVPLGMGVILVPPSTDLVFPKFNNESGHWEEDRDSIATYLKQRVDNLEADVQNLQEINKELSDKILGTPLIPK